ncbi:MAG: hypothetical protein IMZ60_02550 [Actinobacteria bacterium]|nr:hypothetical protein [Actinomycetota bacterium]
MKFNKGMKEKLLWEFLHYNIFDYFESLVDYPNNKLLTEGVIKNDVEIIIKINGKIQPDDN